MKFIGQRDLVKELDLLLMDVRNGIHHNFLFIAPSGYGKTSLSFGCMNFLGANRCLYSLGIFNYHPEVVLFIIDEAHEIKEPEFIYPYMDAGKNSFLFLSNEMGKLKEPLTNRCIHFIFKKYTEEEMREMIIQNGVRDENAIEKIILAAKGVPRVTKTLCQRIEYIYRNGGETDINKIIEDVMDINESGLNKLDRIYLEFLRRAGGRASLELISYGTGIDRTTIMRDIEPGLIFSEKIKITSKGRELC